MLWIASHVHRRIGVGRDQVRLADHNDAARALVGTYRRLSEHDGVGSAVAALYAYERQVPAVAQAKLAGLRAHYGITEGPGLAFFQTHADLDVVDLRPLGA